MPDLVLRRSFCRVYKWVIAAATWRYRRNAAITTAVAVGPEKDNDSFSFAAGTVIDTASSSPSLSKPASASAKLSMCPHQKPWSPSSSSAAAAAAATAASASSSTEVVVGTQKRLKTGLVCLITKPLRKSGTGDTDGKDRAANADSLSPVAGGEESKGSNKKKGTGTSPMISKQSSAIPFSKQSSKAEIAAYKALSEVQVNFYSMFACLITCWLDG